MKITKHMVQGKTYEVYGDFIARGMFATNEDGETKMIKSSGYLNNDLSIRKAIAVAFRLSSFRK